MDRTTIQKILDGRFFDEGLKTYFGWQESNIQLDEYLIFYFGGGTDTEYSDNTPLISDKNVSIFYYSIDKEKLDKRSKEVAFLMRENNFSVLDSGSDIPADIGADIWGVAMEFYYENVE